MNNTDEPLPARGEAALPHPCPNCGEARLTLSWWMIAKPIGDFSLAGRQLKFSVVQNAAILCGGCGTAVFGRITDGTLSADGNRFTGGHFEPHDQGEQA